MQITIDESCEGVDDFGTYPGMNESSNDSGKPSFCVNDAMIGPTRMTVCPDPPSESKSKATSGSSLTQVKAFSIVTTVAISGLFTLLF